MSALLFCCLLVGWLEKPFIELGLNSVIKQVGTLSLMCIFLLTCIMAPTYWSMSVFPEPRGLLSGVYVTVIYLGLVGIVLGSFIASNYMKKFGFRLENIAIVILFILLSIYLIHFLPSITLQISSFQKRAALWDSRDAQIQDSKRNGQSNLIVTGIDSISRIIELQPNESYWVNRCAAIYYGVDSIASTE